MRGSAKGGAAGIVIAVLSTAATDVFGGIVLMAEVALLGLWLCAGAVITSRRTPLRGIPALGVTLAAVSLWASPRMSDFMGFVDADPWRLTWGILAIGALIVATWAAHRYDAHHHPRAHAQFLRDAKAAAFPDTLTYRHVRRFVVDPFTDPGAVTR